MRGWGPFGERRESVLQRDGGSIGLFAANGDRASVVQPVELIARALALEVLVRFVSGPVLTIKRSASARRPVEHRGLRVASGDASDGGCDSVDAADRLE